MNSLIPAHSYDEQNNQKFIWNMGIRTNNYTECTKHFIIWLFCPLYHNTNKWHKQNSMRNKITQEKISDQMNNSNTWCIFVFKIIKTLSNNMTYKSTWKCYKDTKHLHYNVQNHRLLTTLKSHGPATRNITQFSTV